MLHLAAPISIPAEVAVATVTQIGTIIGLIVTIVLGAKTKGRAEEAGKHAREAARDASVVRAETRNAHNPDQPMRHDMDQILANQQNAIRAQEAFEGKVMSKLDGHDKELRGIREDGINQWDAINSALSTANAAVAASSATVRAAERTVTEAVKLKE